MSDRQYDSTNAHVSPAAQTTFAIAAVAALFALLVAAAHPTLASAAALGGLTSIGVWRAGALLRDADGICIPGTDVCLRTPSA
jgi:hypothetical protein